MSLSNGHWIKLGPVTLKLQPRDIIGGLLPLLFAVALSVVVIIYREELRGLAAYGYVGIFIACIAANSTVFLPAPSSAIVLTFAHVYTPFWVAVSGGLGATIGELVGYVAGLSGRRIIDTGQARSKVQTWMVTYGMVAIFILAFLPLPLFDLVGVAAGVTRMPLLRFLLPTVAGKLLKMLVYAYVGAGLLPLLESYVQKAFE